jgi:hypothetical protein
VADSEGVGLAARVIELGPDRHAGIMGGLDPPGECGQVTVVLDYHVAGFTQLGAIDHHVAGDQQPVPALTPPAVEALEAGIG